MDNNKKVDQALKSAPIIEHVLRHSCKRHFGVLDLQFLCQSIGILDPAEPIVVPESETIRVVTKLLKANKVGCIVIVNDDGVLSGIFSERDYMLKVYGDEKADQKPVSEYMTRNPVCEAPDIPIAYALNLMSQGGFRHLPLVDSLNAPVAIISIKDVIDYIVSSYIDDIMKFEADKETA